jgi:predicted secreted hydrolase
MISPASDFQTMKVAASFVDAASGETISFDLAMRQQGQPLLVWGDGVSPQPVGSGTDPLQIYNYYYSFTNLQASGTISIGSEVFQVLGTTWMDHEYGAFASAQAGVLQDAQLNNGVHLSSFFSSITPVEGQQTPSHVTILSPDGNSTFYNSLTTPLGPVWKSAEGVSYCLTYQVDIPDADACLTFVSSMPDQEFASQYAPVYEGVATVTGHYAGQAVSGTAWIEQALGPLTA